MSHRELLRGLALGFAVIFSAGALAQQGSITFTPVPPPTIPTLSGALLLSLGLLLAVMAWRGFRQRGSGLASVLLLSALALGTTAGGAGLLTRAVAGGALTIVSLDEPSTFALEDAETNVITNASGVGQRVSALSLPGECPNADVAAGGADSACTLDSEIAAGNSCSVDCTDGISVAPGTVLQVDGSAIDVEFVPCGTGNDSCTADAARQACQDVGKRVVSHASDGSPTVQSLGATSSCQWSIGYYNADTALPDGACLAGVSNLDWSSCCTTDLWHGNTVPFPEPGTTFGFVNESNSGYFSELPNQTGTTWGCQSLDSPASAFGSCTTLYVACTSGTVQD
jgi:hypothetical protein